MPNILPHEFGDEDHDATDEDADLEDLVRDPVAAVTRHNEDFAQPPANAAETMDRLKGLFAECEESARFFMRRSRTLGLGYDMRCAYAGLAGRLAWAAGAIAGRIERAERSET